MVAQIHSALAILRRKQVEARTGLTRSLSYARMRAGTFPTNVNLGGGRAVGWIEAEVEDWHTAQVEKCRKA